MERVREISGCWEGLWAFLWADKACSNRDAVRGAESAAAPPPLYLLCCCWFSLSAPLCLYLLYSPCHLPHLSPAKLLGCLFVLEWCPWIRKCQHTRASKWKWLQLATKQLKTIQIIIHCGIKVRWNQLLEHVILSSTARFTAVVSSSSIFIYSLSLFLLCIWAKPSLVHLLLKSPENSTCSPSFAHIYWLHQWI